jgi:hypothetical protein
MTSTRAFRVGLLLGGLLLVLVGVSVGIRPLSDRLAELSLSWIRERALVPGVALAAVLLSEMPLRDGIRHRTLLNLLLGPASRSWLAVVRTVATALLLAVTGSVVLLVARLAEGEGMAGAPREILAMGLGAFAYVASFGLVHLLTRRGLIGCLVLFGVFDDPLSRIPFALRNLSLSYHLRTLADQVSEIPLPVRIPPPEPSLPFSSFVLLATGVAATLATAVLFRRKNLGELC